MGAESIVLMTSRSDRGGPERPLRGRGANKTRHDVAASAATVPAGDADRLTRVSPMQSMRPLI